MNSLVIGGNGFIGSHVVEALQAGTGSIRVMDPGAPRADIDWSGVDYRRAAFSDVDDLDAALDGVDCVFHLASTTVPGTSNDDPVGDIRDNLIATVGLIERLRARGIGRIVYFSSGGTVYGNPVALPIREDHPTNPISSYGVVKLAVEKYLLMYQGLYGMSPLILRPSNPYGPRQGLSGVQGVIAAFLGRCMRGEPVSVWGDGSTVRDYIYISDLVSLAVSAARTKETGVFNVGSGAGHSLNDIILALTRVIGSAPIVERKPGRAFDVRQVVLDITRAQRCFGWEPGTSLDTGLMRTWQWLNAASARTPGQSGSKSIEIVPEIRHV